MPEQTAAPEVEMFRFKKYAKGVMLLGFVSVSCKLGAVGLL